jgi:hypothetical protein
LVAPGSASILLIIGAALGAIVVVAIAPYCIGWFSVPTGGIGAVTIANYPKGFDYFVIIALTFASAAGALLLSRAREVPDDEPPPASRRVVTIVMTVIVFVTMLIAHDHPYAFMDMFHEGEHLAPASVMIDGGKPYGDIFFLHGFAADGGLDALVLGRTPSILKTRRLQTLLDAAALAMLVPIAAEMTASAGGLIAAVILSLCAIGAGEVAVFPYFRWLPLLVAVWALLAYRGRRWLLFVAAIASTTGILWSLDVGMVAVAATTIVILIYTRRVTLIAAAAIVPPLLLLLAARANLRHFVRDSFVIIPRSIDAIWSLPAKPLPTMSLFVHPLAMWDWLASESARYYLPPVFFGLLLALAIRKRDMRAGIVAIVSIILFRTAAGRCSWSHTRFAIPLLGMAIVAFLLEPLMRGRMNAWRGIVLLIAAVIGFRYFEIAENASLGTKLLTGWPARLRHEGLVPYPMPRGRGIFTYRENAADLAALNELAARAGPGPMFDLSGERALYYFLDRRPATRCPDVAMLSAPELSAEALGELNAHPPVFVVLEGTKILGSLDGITNRERVPPIASWIDGHYPARIQAGRFLVAFRR